MNEHIFNKQRQRFGLSLSDLGDAGMKAYFTDAAARARVHEVIACADASTADDDCLRHWLTVSQDEDSQGDTRLHIAVKDPERHMRLVASIRKSMASVYI